MPQTKTWWGDFEVPQGSIGRWRIGPSTIWIQRLPGEWRIAHEESRETESEGVEVELPCAEVDLLGFAGVTRFAVQGTDQRVRLRPRLADRPVVTRPERPFYVPPGESASIYISTPLWIEISAAGSEVALEDFPVTRPSDTWFGPTPREGELCYATRTSCRLRLENLSIRPHRAVSKVDVINRATTELFLERMQLPAEYLELYGQADGRLWSQDVKLERVEAATMAPLELLSQAPEAARDAQLVAPARKSGAGGVLVRAFGSILNW